VGDSHGLEESLFIESHPIDASDAMVGIPLPQGTPMIDDIPFIGARDPEHGMMPSTGLHGL
jgi:hypothetical protein